MTKQELITLLVGGFQGQSVNGNFSETNDLIVNQLMEEYGVSNADNVYKLLSRASDGTFAVIEEALDRVLPEALSTSIMNSFVNFKSFKRNEAVVFKVPGYGKKRAMLGVVPGAKNGVYRAHKLDTKYMSLKTQILTVGLRVTMEEILLGESTLSEMLEIVLQGFEYAILKLIVGAMRTIKTLAPAANRATAAGFDSDEVDSLVRIASAYGTPGIYCFKSFASKISNQIAYNTNPNVSAIDVEEIRNQGYVGKYKGTNVYILPNYIEDELTNDKWFFSEADAFILPSDAKPVYVATQGSTTMVTNNLPVGGAEQFIHKMVGVGILVYNNLCVYTDSEIATAENGKYVI